MSHVLVVGDLMVDVVVAHKDPIQVGTDTPARVRMAGGGSAANTACWLASLGEAPQLMAARGDDDLGRMAAAALEAAGVTFVGPVLEEHPTGTCVVLVASDGERTMLPDRGANDRLPLSAIIGGLDPMPDWVHLSGYAILHEGSRNAGRAALSAGIAGGAVVSVDAASTAPIKAVGAEAFLNWIDGASLVFANDQEVDALGGVRAVLDHVGAVVVKHGAAGATWTDGRQTLTVDGFPVDAVDSTGAGDAFAAGWIAATRFGAEPQGALAEAVRVGAQAVTQVGARPALPGS
ncbi:carbohydrate kinase family protein [Aquihabitans sp. McL0605]|uniref:carbohydrate kinase family protein n=1 Tax=Aquihabitans sp. McL0605 TaxID=3415671 RepID=UPI003CF18CB7